MSCDCHLIDWSKGPGSYILKSTNQVYDPEKHGWICCQHKVNEGLMSMITYGEICQYIPGYPGSKFPEDVYKILLGEPISEEVPPIPERLFKESTL
jgi:hypothetical protein